MSRSTANLGTVPCRCSEIQHAVRICSQGSTHPWNIGRKKVTATTARLMLSACSSRRVVGMRDGNETIEDEARLGERNNILRPNASA